jgi:hypothetical protein
VVDFSHLKPPAEAIGPLTVATDHERGELEVQVDRDPLALLRAAGRLTAGPRLT